MLKATTGGHTPLDGATTVVPTALFDAVGLKNSPVSFAIIASSKALFVGTDYDTNNDGSLDLPADASVLDAVGWAAEAAGEVAYGAVLAEASGSPDGATRFATDTTPNSPTAWYNGALADALVYDPAKASANFPAGGKLTPGGMNFPYPPTPEADAGDPPPPGPKPTPPDSAAPNGDSVVTPTSCACHVTGGMHATGGAAAFFSAVAACIARRRRRR
jgi:hypothetical protein